MPVAGVVPEVVSLEASLAADPIIPLRAAQELAGRVRGQSPDIGGPGRFADDGSIRFFGPAAELGLDLNVGQEAPDCGDR